VFDKDWTNAHEGQERNKLNTKVLYQSAIFAIIIEILITKNWRMSARFAYLDCKMCSLGMSATSVDNEKFGRTFSGSRVFIV